MGKALKVLVVDDDRRMVKTICDILKVKGFVPIEARSGEEALEKVRTEDPECVLMDITMEGMNGVEALRLIKALRPGLPVVLMSAYATDELRREAREEGAYAVLTKPFDIQMVLSFLSLLRKEQSVLVIDDDPVFCATIKDLLQTRGYRVNTETDPDNVLEHFEQGYQLVVLLDLKIRNASGIDVLKSIRAKYPTKPVLLLTGGADMAGSIAKGFEIGAHTCIYKPLELEPLLRSISQIRREKLQNALAAQTAAPEGV